MDAQNVDMFLFANSKYLEDYQMPVIRERMLAMDEGHWRMLQYMQFNDPVIILADEPTANLDTKTGADIIDLLNRLRRERNITVISATHDMKMLDVSDRILWIRDGKVDRLEERKDLKITVGGISGH